MAALEPVQERAERMGKLMVDRWDETAMGKGRQDQGTGAAKWLLR